MAKKRNKGSGRTILIILVVVAVGLWLMLQQNQETKPTGGGTGHKYQVQKTGAGVTIDFSKPGRDLDAVVIKAVKDSGFKYVVADRETRQVSRQQIEGSIKWENRHITVAIPSEVKKASFSENLANAVKKAGGQVFGSHQETLEGRQAMRIDIGFEDSLEGEPITVATHNIWLMIQADAPVAPPKAAEPLITAPKSEKSQQSKQPSSKQLGRLALVIDDCGLTMDGIADLLALEQPLTFAVLPYHQYSGTIARQAAAQGKQVLVHLPLESLGGERAEPTTILTTMTNEQIRDRTGEAIAAVPQSVGVNNHQGSKATADPRVMKAAMAVMQERGLSFLDSRTNAGSVAYGTAKAMGMRAVENDHFIDNSSDVETIKRELRTAGKLAISQGEAVAIGHIRPNTVIALREMLPELESMGVKMVFVSELAR